MRMCKQFTSAGTTAAASGPWCLIAARTCGTVGSLFAAAALLLLPLSDRCCRWAGGAVDEEMTEGEAMSEREKARAEILAKMTERHGCQEFELGTVGGTWLSSINNDPKSFNTMLGARRRHRRPWSACCSTTWPTTIPASANSSPTWPASRWWWTRRPTRSR